jgi:leader peptidase (prepilin peptidase)/N-methyltransferase
MSIDIQTLVASAGIGAMSSLLIGATINSYLNEGYDRKNIRNCIRPIHVRLLIASALVFMLCASVYDDPLVLLTAWWFSALLLCLIVIDAKLFILPNGLCYTLMWSGLLFHQQDGTAVAGSSALWGAASGYMVLWIIAHLYSMLRKREGMGHGDFKLCAALGAWLGIGLLDQLILLASLSGVIYGVLSKVRYSNDLRGFIAFGPHLAIAGWLLLLYPEWFMRAHEQSMRGLVALWMRLY